MTGYVEIVFQNDRMRRDFNDSKWLIRTYGAVRASLIEVRLNQMRVVVNLADLRRLPQVRCHELKGTRAGQLALDLTQPYRLIIEPANNPVPQEADGGLDWTQITAIKIIEVVNYHG